MHTHHNTPSRGYVNSEKLGAYTSLACQCKCVALRSPSNASPSKINEKRQHTHEM